MRTLLFRLREGLGIVGLPALAWVGPAWLVRPTYLALARDLDGDLPGVPATPGVSWTTLEGGDVPALLDANPGLSRAEVDRRCDDWGHCHLAWVGGALAHYHWEATGRPYLPYLGRRMDLSAGEYLIAETFTTPRFRQRGLHAAASLACLHRARGQGFSRVVGFVAAWNAPSLRVASRVMGRVLVGTAGQWRLGPLRIPVVAGAVTIASGCAVDHRLDETIRLR